MICITEQEWLWTVRAEMILIIVIAIQAIFIILLVSKLKRMNKK